LRSQLEAAAAAGTGKMAVGANDGHVCLSPACAGDVNGFMMRQYDAGPPTLAMHDRYEPYLTATIDLMRKVTSGL
jgi:hypothetical protein